MHTRPLVARCKARNTQLASATYTHLQTTKWLLDKEHKATYKTPYRGTTMFPYTAVSTRECLVINACLDNTSGIP